MHTTNTLAHGNRLQRAYYRWAQPKYAQIGRDDPGLALEIEEIDQFIYSRRGLPAWLGWGLGLAGVVVGIHATGSGWLEAIQLGAVLWVVITLTLVSAWFSPNRASSSKLGKRFGLGLLLGVAGAGVGLLMGHWSRNEALAWGRLQEVADRAAGPILLLALGMALLVAGVSWAGRKAREQRLQNLQLMVERDAARAAAAETELRLLQAQIHPHFVFNTLATLQHWVDRADPRAGPLLRELTSFLRGSTEMLGRPLVPLQEEAQAAGHYLAIMQARMGQRLRFAIDLDPRCGEQMMPPGLLLTLVENAIEHGLEPKIEGGTLRLISGCGTSSAAPPGHRGTPDAFGDGGSWWLRVEDDGMGLSPNARDQVGLSNLRQRLQQHYGPRARFTLQALSTGGTRAELHFEEAACTAS